MASRRRRGQSTPADHLAPRSSLLVASYTNDNDAEKNRSWQNPYVPPLEPWALVGAGVTETKDSVGLFKKLFWIYLSVKRHD